MKKEKTFLINGIAIGLAFAALIFNIPFGESHSSEAVVQGITFDQKQIDNFSIKQETDYCLEAICQSAAVSAGA